MGREERIPADLSDPIGALPRTQGFLRRPWAHRASLCFNWGPAGLVHSVVTSTIRGTGGPARQKRGRAVSTGRMSVSEPRPQTQAVVQIPVGGAQWEARKRWPERHYDTQLAPATLDRMRAWTATQVQFHHCIALAISWDTSRAGKKCMC